MNQLKFNILTVGLFIFAINANVIGPTNPVSAAVIPFEDIRPMDTTKTGTGATTPVTPTTPNSTSPSSSNQNNLQLKSSGGGGTGTSSNAANKSEQDDLYNQSVNKMLEGK